MKLQRYYRELGDISFHSINKLVNVLIRPVYSSQMESTDDLYGEANKW